MADLDFEVSLATRPHGHGYLCEISVPDAVPELVVQSGQFVRTLSHEVDFDKPYLVRRLDEAEFTRVREMAESLTLPVVARNPPGGLSGCDYSLRVTNSTASATFTWWHQLPASWQSLEPLFRHLQSLAHAELGWR